MVPQSIWYGEERINFSVRYNHDLKRKITVSVDENGTVRVAAPKGTDFEDIRKAVRKRARWISKKVGRFKEQTSSLLPRSYVSGETHLYMGKQYLLKVEENPQKKQGVKLVRGYLMANTHTKDPNEVKNLLQEWYRKHAREFFKRRMKELVSQIEWLTEKQTPSLRLQKMKKQWGSCSPHGQVLLNPDLIKAPRECIDYVIIHELCHLKEHNHSRRFYCLLTSAMPNWEPKKQLLDEMASRLIH
ncbi:MAG: SprT family zinc-dependent metalloprotease [Sedimenticola sp.]